jgi:hypothetical protein
MKERVTKSARVSQRIDWQLDCELRSAAAKLRIRRADIVRNALVQYLRDLGKSSSIKVDIPGSIVDSSTP